MARVGYAVAILTLVGLAAWAFAGAREEEARESVALNIHKVENLGCARRGWSVGLHVTQADRTLGATPLEGPAPYTLLLVDVSLPAELSLEVRSLRGFRDILRPEWGRCDLGAHAEEHHVVRVPRGGQVSLDTRGGGDYAVGLVGVVGPATSVLPTPAELAATARPECVHLAWTVSESDPPDVAQELHLDRDAIGLPPEAREHTWCGLAERSGHSARLIRSWQGWRVAAPAVEIVTPNGPPLPPALSVIGGLDELNVSWQAEQSGDVASVELFCSIHPPSEPPTGSRCARGISAGSATIPWRGPASVHVVAIATDYGGARSSSNATAHVAARPAPPSPEPPLLVARPTGVLASWKHPVVAGVEAHEIRIVGLDGATAEIVRRVPMPALTTTIGGLRLGADHEVSLRAIGRNGLTSESDSVRYRHDLVNSPPQISLGANQTARAWAPFELEVVVEDPDPGDEVSLTIDWGDGSDVSAAARHHVYTAAGTRFVRAVVEDALGARGEASGNVMVLPNAPPSLRLDLSLGKAFIDEVVVARIATSDPDGDPLEAFLDWGDGDRAALTSDVVGHAYSRAGAFRVVATAVDVHGAATTTNATLRVVRQLPAASTPTPASTPPPATAAAPPTSPPAEGDSPRSPFLPPTDEITIGPIGVRGTPWPSALGLVLSFTFALARRRGDRGSTT